MPVRYSFRPVRLHSGMLLSQYWGATAYHRPEIDFYLVGPTGAYIPWSAQVDCASDWVVFDAGVAVQLGLRPPFSRQVAVSGIAGAAQAHFTLPPDGTVAILLTDYREYYYLPAPPVGFWPAPNPPTASRRSVLGVTGFLQHFRVVLNYELPRPEVEFIAHPGFPGEHGQFPSGTPLGDFFRELRSTS